MSKVMQKIILFIEPNDDAWQTPVKIGNLIMNRSVVEEDAASEVLKIFELEKTSYELSHPRYKYNSLFGFTAKGVRKQKGKDLINFSY